MARPLAAIIEATSGRRWRTFPRLRDEVLQAARPDDSRPWVPGGDEAYASTIRFYTTVSLSAQEIHDIGLAQVESLAREYRALGPDVVGTGDLTRIFEALRSDPALHHHDADEIVAASKTAMAKARAAMGDWFGPCRKPTATSRRRRTARSPTTSRRPRTAAAAASSS